MAVKKESAQVSVDSEKLEDKKVAGLIRVRKDLKNKWQQKDYEAGIDPQDDQLNTVPEGDGKMQGDSKPGGGNRLHSDTHGKRTTNG